MQRTSFAQSDPIMRQLKDLTEGKRVVVLAGFSGLGYKDIDALRQRITWTLDSEIAAHGAENLLIVVGATDTGIGVAYELAKHKGLTTAGIVSEWAGENGTSAHCDHVVLVPDPERNGKVLAGDGRSYMVSVAQNNGVYYAFGGGEVTLSELREARERHIETIVDASFEPNPGLVAKGKMRDPSLNPTPVKAWLDEQDRSQ